jgi:hypothetical protein
MPNEKGTMDFPSGSGSTRTYAVNYVLDIRDFKGRAGFPWLLIAANPHLPVRVLALWLRSEGANNERSESWIYRHRWLFRDPEKSNGPGVQPNADGKDGRAIQIMRQNSTLSARKLSRLLKEHGINRNKDWVWKHRCD